MSILISLPAAAAHGMVTMPGVFTPTEALLAAKAGASSLKFFPASVLGAAGITAIRAVLPADLMIAAVGGVSDKNFADYIRAGIVAFGLGSSLYKPGHDGGGSSRSRQGDDRRLRRGYSTGTLTRLEPPSANRARLLCPRNDVGLERLHDPIIECAPAV